MKVHRRRVLQLATGLSRFRPLSRMRAGAGLSGAAGALDRYRSRRRLARHRRTPDGAMAVGAARPALRRREPAGRQRPISAPKMAAEAPPDGYTLLLVRSPNAINASLYRNLNFNFIRDTVPVAESPPFRCVMEVNPVGSGARPFPSSSPMPRPIPARSTWRRRASAAAAHVAGELFKMMAGVDMVARALSRRGAGAARSDQRPGPGHVRRHADVARLHQSRQAARAGGDHRDALRRPCRTCRPWANSCRATRPAAGTASSRPKARPRRSSTSSTREINAALADPTMKTRLADLGCIVSAGLARRFRKVHRRRNREVGQGDQVRRHQGRLAAALVHAQARSQKHPQSPRTAPARYALMPIC